MKTKKQHLYLMQVMILFMSVLILWCTSSVIANGLQLWRISDEIHHIEQDGSWTDTEHSRYNELIEQRLEIRDSSWIGYVLVRAGANTYTSLARDTFLGLGLIPLLIAQALILGSEALSGKSLDERIIIAIGRSPITKFIRNFFIIFGALPLAYLFISLICAIIASDIKRLYKHHQRKKPLRCQKHCRKCSNTNCPSRFRSPNNTDSNKVVSMRAYRKSAHQ